MRRRLFFALGVVLSLSLLLSACGGGGGDDDTDDDASPTSAQASPSARVASPTGAQADVTATPAEGGSSGGISGSASPTAEPTETAAPTATRRPATVISSPRPVFQTPTSPPTAEPTATPTAAGLVLPDNLQVLVSEEFDDPAATLFFVGETTFGHVLQVANSEYSMAIQEGGWQISEVVEHDFENGAIETSVRIDGDGAAGVVARLASTDTGSEFELCWINAAGGAGCHVYLNNEFQELLRVPEGTVNVEGNNRLIILLTNGQLSFEVNGQTIGTVAVDTGISGNWGVYAESTTGTVTSYFDYVTIAQQQQQ